MKITERRANNALVALYDGRSAFLDFRELFEFSPSLETVNFAAHLLQISQERSTALHTSRSTLACLPSHFPFPVKVFFLEGLLDLVPYSFFLLL